MPTARTTCRRRRPVPLKDKEGLEIDQSLLLAHILADPRCGTHLCHAMLLPRPETAAALATLAAQGFVDLGPVRRRAAWPGGASAEQQPALSECRGPGHDQCDGNRRGCRDAGPRDGNRGAARAAGGARQICRTAHLRRRHQPDASVSRNDSVSLVSAARTGVRAQVSARCRHA